MGEIVVPNSAVIDATPVKLEKKNKWKVGWLNTSAIEWRGESDAAHHRTKNWDKQKINKLRRTSIDERPPIFISHSTVRINMRYDKLTYKWRGDRYSYMESA